MSGIYKQNSMEFTPQAKNIIDTYASINDRLSVVYAREFNKCEYKNLIPENEWLLSCIEFGSEKSLFVLCSREDDEENISYILHKYKFENGKHSYITSTTIP